MVQILLNFIGTLHILCPLQLQEKELSATNLIGIMNATREPDMSMPISLKGLPLDEALIPKLTADEERFNHLKSTKAIEKVKSLTTANEVRSLTKSLCYFDVAGNEVYDNNEYWMQNSSETLRNTAGSSNTSVSNIDVRSTDLTPNYNVTSSGMVQHIETPVFIKCLIFYIHLHLLQSFGILHH